MSTDFKIFLFVLALTSANAGLFAGPEDTPPMTVERAIEIVNDPSHMSDERYEAVHVLLKSPSNSMAVKCLILAIDKSRDLDFVMEIVDEFNPELVEDDPRILDHLLTLLKFEDFENGDRYIRGGSEPSIVPSENEVGREIRIFAARTIPAIVFRDPIRKSRAVEALYHFVDHSYNDQAVGLALQALYVLGERGESLMRRLIRAVNDDANINAKVWALSIMGSLKLAADSREIRLSVMRALSRNSWMKHVFDPEEMEAFAMLSMNVVEYGFEALGLNEKIGHLVEGITPKPKVDMLPLEALGILAGNLLERKVSTIEGLALVRFRQQYMTSRGESLDLADHELTKLVSIDLVVSELRRFGFKDFNQVTGVSEIRLLMESGLMGFMNPPKAKCDQLISDMGRLFGDVTQRRE